MAREGHLQVEVILPDNPPLKTKSTIVVPERRETCEGEFSSKHYAVLGSCRGDRALLEIGLERKVVPIKLHERSQLDALEDIERIRNLDEGVEEIVPPTGEQVVDVPVSDSEIELQLPVCERDLVREADIVVEFVIEAGSYEIVVKTRSPPDVRMKAGLVGKDETGLEHWIFVKDPSVSESDVFADEVA